MRRIYQLFMVLCASMLSVSMYAGTAKVSIEYNGDEPKKFIPLITSADQFYSNEYGDRDEGQNLGALIDNDDATIWHSDYRSETVSSHSDPDHHWLPVHFNSSVKGELTVGMIRRLDSENNHPTKMLVEGSNDGANWTSVTTLSFAYSGQGTQTQSESFRISGAGYTYLRFAAIQVNASNENYAVKFWHAAEFQVFSTRYEITIGGENEKTQQLSIRWERADGYDLATPVWLTMSPYGDIYTLGGDVVSPSIYAKWNVEKTGLTWNGSEAGTNAGTTATYPFVRLRNAATGLYLKGASSAGVAKGDFLCRKDWEYETCSTHNADEALLVAIVPSEEFADAGYPSGTYVLMTNTKVNGFAGSIGAFNINGTRVPVITGRKYNDQNQDYSCNAVVLESKYVEVAEDLASIYNTFKSGENITGPIVTIAPDGSKTVYDGAEATISSSVSSAYADKPIGNKSRYLYNVETGTFLYKGNEWGTRTTASLQNGLLVSLVEDGDAYRLMNKNDDGYALDCKEEDKSSWVDGQGRTGDGKWTFTALDGNTYNIMNTVAGDLKWGVKKDLSDTRIYFNNDDETYANTWAFLDGGANEIYFYFSRKVLEGDELTISFDYKASNPFTTTACSCRGNIGEYGRLPIELNFSTEWQTISKTFTVTSDMVNNGEMKCIAIPIAQVFGSEVSVSIRNLTILTKIFDMAAYPAGSALGQYKDSAVQAFTSALNNADMIEDITSLDGDRSDAASWKHIVELHDAYTALLQAKNKPVLNGYYRIVNTNKNWGVEKAMCWKKSDWGQPILWWNTLNNKDLSQIWKIEYNESTGKYLVTNLDSYYRWDSRWNYRGDWNEYVWVSEDRDGEIDIEYVGEVDAEAAFKLKTFGQFYNQNQGNAFGMYWWWDGGPNKYDVAEYSITILTSDSEWYIREVEDLNIEENYTLADGTIYTNDAAIFAKEFHYTRNLKNTQLQAMYVPVSLPLETFTDQGVRVYYLNDNHAYFDENGALESMTMEVVPISSGTLIANTPYVIRATQTGQKDFVAKDVVVYPAETKSVDCSSTSYLFTFTGTNDKIASSVLRSNGYYFFSGGGLKQIGSSTASLGAQRWYLDITSRGTQYSPKPTEVKVVVFGEEDIWGEETGIDFVKEVVGDDDTYDLSGRKITTPVQRGLYIQNGRKFIK